MTSRHGHFEDCFATFATC